jgi:integrase
MFLIKHQNGRYYAVYSLENGKRKTISTGTHLKSEANKFLSNLQRKIEEEKKQVVKPIRIKEFGFYYLRQREVHFAEKTIKVNKTTFKYLENYLGNIQLSDITRNNLEEYFNFRIKKTSIYTARRDMINVSASFNYAVNYGYLISNPCKGIKRFKLPEVQPKFYTKEEFNNLLNAIDNQDLKDLVLFAVNTGMRQMELITLEWRQINFDENYLTLDNQVHITKSKRIRTIPLNSTSKDIMKRRLETASTEYKNVFTLFGKPFEQHWLSKKFKAYVIKRRLILK